MEQDEDDYVCYGTPLPELEDESVQRKKAAKELEVRDEKGRQRFHGAFTGGFSAGYFNTVGTKEGWAPSTFVSSRNKTAERFQQNPEDFMDEEDLGEFGISTRRIQTTSKFSDSSELKSNKRKYNEVDSIIPGEAPLKDLVKPVSESIGIEILKKLGWKLGQGIGPRVKKDSGATKVYGCSPFPDNSRTEEDDPVSQLYTFAPKDTEAGVYAPKDDVFGLGYTGLSKQSILGPQIDTFNPTFTKSFLKKDKKKITISGQAFGVGAFEDDDEDIYSKDDMSQYDFSDLGTNASGQMSSKTASQQVEALGQMLEGFRLATEPPPIKKYYPPPNLPPHYRPIRSSIPKVPIPVEPHFSSRHAMSSGDRSILLGEKKFQSFQVTSAEKSKPETKIDNISKPVPLGSSTKHTFRPFPNDPQKQQRYEEYLKLKETQEVDKLVQPPSMTEWERQQEIEEFSRAAILFKPLSAALSSKFESKSHLSVEHEVMEAIAKSKKESENSKATIDKRKLVGLSKRRTIEWHPASLLCKRFNVPNPYPNSSEVSGSQKSKSLFDHISFESRDSLPNASHSTLKSNTQIPAHVESYKPEESTTNIKETSSSEVLSNRHTDIQEPSTENEKPPIDFFKDIFENSSSDEEESTKPELPTKDSNLSPKIISTTENTSTQSVSPNDLSGLKSTKESKKVGFGVFANLDLDALNQRTSVVKSGEPKDLSDASRNTNIETKGVESLNSRFSGSLSPNTSVVKPTENSDRETVNKVRTSESLSDKMEVCSSSPTLATTSLGSDNLYGPELPPNYSDSTSSTSKSVHKKHSKSKTKHKHKHHKHKSKKKKKKQSSHKSSDESSFPSDEDIPPTVILEKLKKLQKVLKSDH